MFRRSGILMSRRWFQTSSLTSKLLRNISVSILLTPQTRLRVSYKMPANSASLSPQRGEISSRCDKTPLLSAYLMWIGIRPPCSPESISIGRYLHVFMAKAWPPPFRLRTYVTARPSSISVNNIALDPPLVKNKHLIPLPVEKP